MAKQQLSEQLAAIWEDILGLKTVKEEDNFFALGGHSLLAVKLTARIQDETGVEVALEDLYKNPTLAEFSALMRQRQAQLAK